MTSRLLDFALKKKDKVDDDNSSAPGADDVDQRLNEELAFLLGSTPAELITPAESPKPESPPKTPKSADSRYLNSLTRLNSQTASNTFTNFPLPNDLNASQNSTNLADS